MSAVATAEAAAGSDTLRDSLAAKGNPIAALILPKDDPRRAVRKMAYAARNTAEVCGRCGRALKPDEPVWREQCAREPGYFGGTTSILAPVCDACHSQYQRFWHEHPCGHCGRPVYNAVGFDGHDVFCSERCHKEVRKARLRLRCAEARGTRTCPTCGKGFDPKRSDALTCSSRCRQKGYRQRRVTDNSPRAVRAPDSHNGEPATAPFLNRHGVTGTRQRPGSPPESVTAGVSANVVAPNSRNGEADIPAFLDRRNNTNAIPSAEGRSK